RVGIGDDVGERLPDRKERRLVEHHAPAGGADSNGTAKSNPAPAVQRVALHVRAVREVPHAIPLPSPNTSRWHGQRAMGRVMTRPGKPPMIRRPMSSPWRDYAADVILRDGTSVHLRAIRPDDRAELARGFAELSREALYFRFFRAKRRLTDNELAEFTELDFVQRA